MTDDKWEQLIEFVKTKFSNVRLKNEPTEDGSEDILQFDNDAGRFRVVRDNRPVVLEKKMLYSHRQGDTARTEYKLSDTEQSHKLRVYKETDYDEWEEVTLDKLGL